MLFQLATACATLTRLRCAVNVVQWRYGAAPGLGAH